MSDQGRLKTVVDAWELFTTRVIENIRGVHRGALSVDATNNDDEVLAAFIRDHPGAFEERLIVGLPELAIMRWGESEGASALDELAAVDVPGAHDPPGARSGPLDVTLRAFKPLAGLRLCWLLVWRHRVETARWLAELFARRLERTPAPPELPPELCDAATSASLPDVLPLDLDGWSPRDIEAALEHYVGASIEQIEARLRKGIVLGSEESLGALIWRDAATLRGLGVNRQALAERLKQCIMRLQAVPPEYAGPSGWARWCAAWHIVELERGLTVEVQWRGSWMRGDPWHTVFGEEGRSHVAIRSPGLSPDQVMKTCDELTVSMIRRFCLFEGQPERPDLETVARLLGLMT